MIVIHDNGILLAENRRLSLDWRHEIQTLLAMLATHPLDSHQERYNERDRGYWCLNPRVWYITDPNQKLAYPDCPGVMKFWGDFLGYAHSFEIDTDDTEVIQVLQAAIIANTQTEAYMAQGGDRVCRWFATRRAVKKT